MSTEARVGDAAIGLSSGAGLVVAINEYATIISLSLTALGIFVGILFHILAFIHRKRQSKINKAQERDLIKSEILRELSLAKLKDQKTNQK